MTFEPLERRDCMAPLLAVILDGPQSVESGDVFEVRVMAEDVRRNPSGVGGLWLDVEWGDELSLLSANVTDAFPVLRSGVVTDRAIDELGGCRLRSAGLGKAIGTNGPEEFAVLRFEAEATCKPDLQVQVGSRGVGMTWRGALSWRDVDLPGRNEHARLADAVLAGKPDWFLKRFR